MGAYLVFIAVGIFLGGMCLGSYLAASSMEKTVVHQQRRISELQRMLYDRPAFQPKVLTTYTYMPVIFTTRTQQPREEFK